MSKKQTRKTSNLNLLVKKYINNFPVGTHRSILRGWGGDFDITRPMQPEDRFIHMPATVRTGELQAKVFQEPKQLTVHALIDQSRSMAFGSEITKGEAAAVLAACFENSAAKIGDRFKSTTFGDGVLYPPLERLVNADTRHTLIVILSDFFFTLEKKEVNLIRQLASNPGTTVLSLILHDQQEESRQDYGFLADICDAEGDDLLLWDFSSDALAQAEREFLEQWQREIVGHLRQAQSEYVLLDISENFVRQLARHFYGKSQYAI